MGGLAYGAFDVLYVKSIMRYGYTGIQWYGGEGDPRKTPLMSMCSLAFNGEEGAMLKIHGRMDA